MIAIILLLQLLFVGCVGDPVAPGGLGGDWRGGGVLVVNEGLWRQDNATLTLYNPATGASIDDYFLFRNPGLRLGDVANSITIWNRRAYISVSTSQAVEVIELETGRSLGRAKLPLRNEPRYTAVLDSSAAFATSLADSVIEFDPITLQPVRSIPVGPAPDGIVIARNRLFVANSGYGYFRRHEPKAGTISVIDLLTRSEVAIIPVAQNPRKLVYLPNRDRLYILYGLADTLGGVIEFDPVTLRATRHWPVLSALDMAFDEEMEIGYASGRDGIVRFNLASAEPPQVMISGSAWPGRIFYSLGVDRRNGLLHIGSVLDYSAAGEVLIFTRNGNLAGTFSCGINPGDFAFY